MNRLSLGLKQIATLTSKSSNVLFNQNTTRTLAFFREPQNLVKFDDSINSRDIKIPYLRDNIRQEIYAKHCLNPVDHSIENLAREYKANIDRIKGIIYLMRKRYDLMKSKGFNISFNRNKNRAEVKVEIPQLMNDIYQFYLANEKPSPSDLLKKYNETAGEGKALKINEEEVKKILDNMIDHKRREENLATYNNLMEDVLEDYANFGAHTNFQEISKVHKGSLTTETYFPDLLRDDQYEDEKERLLKIISSETKAEVNIDPALYLKRRPQVEDVTPDVKAPEHTAASRWKLAFKDTSKTSNKSTVIRTRTGKFRTTTPLEEAALSWNRTPNALENFLAKELDHFSHSLVKPFQDFDKEDKLTAEIKSKKIAKKKSITAQAKK